MAGEFEDEFKRPVPPKGKLHKGVVLQPERTRSTIPTKSELLGPPKRHERPQSGKDTARAKTEKAFSASAKSRPHHFGQVVGEQQYTPGPGSYGVVEERVKSDPSTSKRGSGNGFASTTKRFPMVSPASKSSPAPGQYYDSKKDSSIHVATPKAIPNYSEELPEHEPTPGPGFYDPHDINYPEPNRLGSAAFVSTDKRTKFLPGEGDKHTRRMGPGKYDYNDTRGKQVSVSSPFRSGTQKGLRFDSSATPGPGSYKTTEDLVSNTNEKSPKMKLVPQGRILTSSVPTTVDMTNSKKYPSPGPGEYMPIYPSSPPVSHPSPSAPPRIRARSVPTSSRSSSFASTTQRIEFSAPSTAPTSLGPGEYHSEAPLVKQSFHANRREKWV